DDARREAMARRARDVAVERYSWPKVAALHEAIWDELCTAAAADPDPPSGAWIYPWAEPSRVFHGHPSEWVTEDTLVRMSDRGVAALRGRDKIAPDLLAQPLLNGALMQRLLQSCG